MGEKLQFSPLKHMQDGITVTISSSRDLSGKLHFVCLHYEWQTGLNDDECIDLRSPLYSWVDGELWWTPVVKQHFPYVLGVDRSWLKATITLKEGKLVLAQEITRMRAGLLAFPRYTSETSECILSPHSSKESQANT
ncbi:MAG: hypothetical protein KDD64_10770 [Bdellovibrionales bacterium]|nr:hypothetical protein [Bdellovibrionales bacterium]